MRIFNIEIRRNRVRDEYLNNRDSSFITRWARPPSRNTAEWLAMFAKSPRLAVVDRIASDIAAVPGKLYHIQPDGTEIELKEHPFLDLLDRPNPLYEMTSAALWRLHEIYLLLVGESYLLIERDEHGRPVELWPVPPHWVKMTPYLGHPVYEVVTTSGLSMSVPVDDMFVMKQLNPLDPFMRGLGTAESIADEVEIDEYAAKFQKRFFYNDATPSVVFGMPGATPEQRDAFMARWNQKHRGVENSHRAAAITGDIQIHEIGTAEGKNLGFIESRVSMRDAVLEHFGVPREIMGITENSNRATADSAQYIYAKNVLTPKINSRSDAINIQLLPMFGENLVWRFDPVIPYDQEFNRTTAIESYNAGLITKNEARELIDRPALDDGDVFKVSINDIFMGENDDPVAVSQALLQDVSADAGFYESAGEGTGEKKARRVNINAMLRKEAIAEAQCAAQFETAVLRHFSEQQAAIEKVLGLTTKAADDLPTSLTDLERFLLPDGTFDPEVWAGLTAEEQMKLTDAVAGGLLNWREEAQKLNEAFVPLWKHAYTAGAELSEESYGIFNVQRPELVSPARINGGKRVVGIEHTTRKSIADIIARGIANGSSQKELRKEIQSEMGTTKSRAKLIARQETSTALATGQFDMMKAAGAQTKTWHHRPQKNPRDGTHGKPNHVAMEGETVPIDGVFSNGLRFPRDPDDPRPEELINCRCYVTYGGF